LQEADRKWDGEVRGAPVMVSIAGA
jgi:hypothetical protein